MLFNTALIAALARVPLTINLPAVRLWSGILTVGAAGMYMATLLRERSRIFPTALLLAFIIDQFLRAATALLNSHLEQTAIVHASVHVGDQPLHAYGVWLGLEPDERARQLGDALGIIGAASPAVFGGDFNATPDSPTYARIQAAGFDDPFVVGGFDAVPTSPAIEPSSRIDFVWARGLEVRNAQVLDSLASDHRMVVVELALP